MSIREEGESSSMIDLLGAGNPRIGFRTETQQSLLRIDRDETKFASSDIFLVRVTKRVNNLGQTSPMECFRDSNRRNCLGRNLISLEVDMLRLA